MNYKYTAEQVFLRSEDVKYSADIDFRLTPACAADICKMLRDYATLLREREVAKDCAMHDDPRAESSDAEEIAQWLYANGYHVAAYTIRSQLDARNNRICELEAVAPMLASARVPDGAFIIDRGFQVERGQSIPTVLVGFRIEDWNARDAFAVMLAAATNPEKE